MAKLKTDWILIELVALVYTAWVVVSEWQTFSISYPFSEYERRYSQSQYVLGENRTYIMGDGEIYTYAGIRYVEGEDVTKIQFDSPPLIKYLYGLSYLLTGKPNWVLLPLIFIAINAFWYLTKRLFRDTVWRFLALLFFLGHSVIYKAIPQTMLDFPMTALLLLATVCYLRFLNQPSSRRALIFGFSSGLVVLTKYPFPILVGYIGFLFMYLIFKKISLKFLLLAVLTLFTTYILAYLSFFLHGHSWLDFIRFEWWRWHWFAGKVDAPKGMIWQTLFLGRYPKWWDFSGEYITVTHWNLFWPVSFILFCFSFFFLNKKQYFILPYFIWIICSLIGYSLGVAEDRFLVPLIPGFALGTAITLKFIWEKISKQYQAGKTQEK